MSHRMNQVNELIRSTLSEVIIQDFELPEGVFITITHVKTSADLKKASVFVTIYPSESQDTGFEWLKKNIGDIQEELNDRIYLKYSPRIFFRIDETAKRAQDIYEILDSTKENG